MRRQVETSGCDDIMSSFQYAEEMNEILNMQPIVTCDVGTTPLSDSNDNSCK